MEKKQYTAHLIKGSAVIPETLILLKLWEPGTTAHQLIDKAIKNDSLGKATASRVQDLIGRIFYKRYITIGDEPAKFLKMLVQRDWPLSDLSQLFLIYSARADMVLFDFITEVYWPKYYADVEEITKTDAVMFIKEAAYKGYLKNQWSDSVIDKTTRGLLGCLTDFKLTGKSDNAGKRKISPYHISINTVNYLAHELHFAGTGDSAIMTHPGWGLFGLKPYDVLEELKRVSYYHHFIVQFSGEILKINWMYKNMEDFIHAITESHL
jgi:hypothetical protein